VIHRQIRQLLDDLRQTTGVLVAIEARFLSVEDNFLEDVGVDLRGLGDDSGGTGRPGRGRSSDLDDFGVPNTGFGTPDNPRGIGTGNDAGVFYDDGSDGNVRARVENLFDLSLGSEDTLTNSGGLTAQYTFLDDTEIEAIFRAVRKSERNQTLTAPRLLVSNNERASISVINEVTYVKDFDVEIAQAAVIADPIMDIVRDGVILDVKPVVSADRKFVTLELRPSVSQLDRPIPTFATTLGTGPPVAIEVPTLQVQRVRTTVTMPDNATLLLGGLKTAEDRKLESGVPFLRNIPILSFFFGRKGSYKAQKNLLILLKARIILMEENQPTAKGFEPR
jgi:type II secretory pathway component GspD/PulD (secretin)